MVTERQVRRLMRELIRGEPLVRAAMRSGMSETTAQRYRGEPGRGRAAAEGGNMTALMAEESRFQIVFDKLSKVSPEQWEPAQSESEVQTLREASEEIAELRRELLEITEPPVSLFTTT